MIVKAIHIDINKLDWIRENQELGYKDALSANQINKSLTFVWFENSDSFAWCRAYFINDKRIELGDVFVAQGSRGKKINGKKISEIFMNKVISKIWSNFLNANTITLLVEKDNIPAIKLYEKLNFNVKNMSKTDIKNSKVLCMKKPILMFRIKKK